jgi:hypothetical protein
LKQSADQKRYQQLYKLREGNTDTEFIYGSMPCESDDVISYMKGMSAEEIFERRKKCEVIYKRLSDSFINNVQQKSCSIFHFG